MMFWILNEHKITPWRSGSIQVCHCSCGVWMGGERMHEAVNEHLLETAKRQRETVPPSQVTLGRLPL